MPFPPRRLRQAFRHLLNQPDARLQAAVSAVSPANGGNRAILCRILGADLPSSAPGSAAVRQLAFLLEHEPHHAGLDKRWLLNRIADSQQRHEILTLLERHGQRWYELPFDALAYANCWTDIGSVPEALHPWNPEFEDLPSDQQAAILDYVARAKSLYLFNRNAARNHVLQLCGGEADWVLPWDGDCFLPAGAWSVLQPLLATPGLRYLVVPAAPLGDVRALLQGLNEPLAPDGPPQLGFPGGTPPPFNPQLRRGAEADLDLLRRLRLGGPWHRQSAEIGSWELLDSTPLVDRGQLVQAGWVYRLPPHAGDDPVEVREAIRLAARRTDMRLVGDALGRQPLRCWCRLASARVPTPGLAAIAANALAVPPLSVTDKPDPIPGTEARSYVNAVPHWQSLAGSESTLDRSALLHRPGPAGGDVAQHYDRARLQLMIDCVCALALDGRINGNRGSIEHAHRLISAWFLDPATAMIPDGAYARLSAVDPARNALDAAIDFRDFYPLLDALTLLTGDGAFSLAEQQQLDEWFDAFLAWLAADSATFLRQQSASPACTWYHLLMLALAAYRGRRNVAAQVFDNLPGLLARQFRPDGSPRSAAAAAPLRHEHLFNLQAWANLVVLSAALGRDLLHFTDSNGIGLGSAFAHARRHLPDGAREAAAGLPASAWLAAMQAQIESGEALVSAPDLPPLPEAGSGLPPFWRFCRCLSTGALVAPDRGAYPRPMAASLVAS
jgi:hypothetical protein